MRRCKRSSVFARVAEVHSVDVFENPISARESLLFAILFKWLLEFCLSKTVVNGSAITGHHDFLQRHVFFNAVPSMAVVHACLPS